jgi:CBS-domain-containing membrane protein
MIDTEKPLLELTAAEIMSREVLTIPQRMSLRAAAHQLAEAGISGAPVVDEAGRCVGVLSTTDVLRWVDRGERAARRPPHSDCFCTDWGGVDLDVLPPDAVSHFMTRDVVATRPEAHLGALARAMIDAHIHRIFVTDGQGRPVGVVSTTDILAAVVREDQRASGAVGGL